MSRPMLLTLWCCCAAAVLALSGCGTGGVEEASDGGAAVAQPAEEGVPPGSDSAEDSGEESADEDSTDSGDSAGSDDGSAGGPDVDAEGAGARPGSPFDVEAFEQVGVSYAEFLSDFASACDGGRCTLSYQFSDDPDRTDGCAVAGFSYDPSEQRPNPENPGKFLIQRGATVTVAIRCAPGVSPEDVSTAESEESTTDETTDETTTDEAPTDEAPTDGTTTDGTTTDGTTTDGTTTDEGSAEETG